MCLCVLCLLCWVICINAAFFFSRRKKKNNSEVWGVRGEEGGVGGWTTHCFLYLFAIWVLSRAECQKYSQQKKRRKGRRDPSVHIMPF